MSEDKRYGNVILLTGAGASAPLGLPTMNSFHDILSERAADLVEMVSYMGLKDAPPDLEAIYDRVQLYRELGSAGLQDGNLQRLVASEIALKHAVFQGGIDMRPSKSRLEQFLTLAVGAQMQLERLILDNWGHVDPDKAEAVYGELLPWLCHMLGGRLTVFTTNYDLTFEDLRLSFEQREIVNGLREDRFRLVWDPSTYERIPGDARLVVYRLHGCSHWFVSGTGEVVYYDKPPFGRSDLRPMVIYPSRAKAELVHTTPFAFAYRALREALREAKVCVIIGYSFRDRAIQEAIGDTPGGLRFLVVDDGLAPDFVERALEGHTFQHLVMKFGESATRDKIVDALQSQLRGVGLVTASRPKWYGTRGTGEDDGEGDGSAEAE